MDAVGLDSPRPGRRARALVITGGVLVVGFFLLTAFASVYTDRLWYKEVGYGQVFTTMLWTRVGLFVVFGLVMAAVVAVNMYLAFRFRPLFRMAAGDASVERYRDAVTPIRGWLLAGVVYTVLVAATRTVDARELLAFPRHLDDRPLESAAVVDVASNAAPAPTPAAPSAQPTWT